MGRGIYFQSGLEIIMRGDGEEQNAANPHIGFEQLRRLEPS